VTAFCCRRGGLRSSAINWHQV